LLGHNLFSLLSDKENINLHVLCAIVKKWIVSNGNDTLIISKKSLSAESNLDVHDSLAQVSAKVYIQF